MAFRLNSVFSVLFVLFTLSVAQPNPPIPTLPRSFATDYSIALNIFNGNYPLLQGHFAVDYDGLGGMIYTEDSPEGGVPWVLQSSLIGHPYQQHSMGYEYLSEGRCWYLGSLGADDFHFVPLAIPPSAIFLGNSTINGDVCSQWSWTATEFLLRLILIVRYTDNAPLFFVVDNSFFFPFILTIKNSRFALNPTKNYFNIPPGPCANKSWNIDTPSFASSSKKPVSKENGFDIYARKIMNFMLTAYSAKSGFMGVLQGTIRQSEKRATDQTPTGPPAPPVPTLNQFFQSDYELGYGSLTADNNFMPSNTLFRGNMAVDKESGGFYVSIDDDSAGDVPFLFSTQAIIHPNTPADGKTQPVTGYMFLHPGRCWLTGDYPLVNPDFPLQIPDNATFVGQQAVYGKPATLWAFNGTVEGYSGVILMAIATSDNSIIFITVTPEYEDLPLSTYLIFNNFNTSKPDPETYGIPPGHCWDPLNEGPGSK